MGRLIDQSRNLRGPFLDMSAGRRDKVAMSFYERFAIYHLPDDPALAAFGASWLGWDIVSARALPAPMPDVVETPARYGFHATVKPPFRLADGFAAAALRDAVARLCEDLSPAPLPGLRLQRLGRFLALVPDGPAPEVDALAARVVTGLDRFRAPMAASELARRDRPHLSPAQRANLMRWGYPHVLDTFRFHMTLTGRLSADRLAEVEATLASTIPDLPRPCTVRSLSLVGERSDGRFEEIERLPLGGQVSAPSSPRPR